MKRATELNSLFTSLTQRQK